MYLAVLFAKRLGAKNISQDLPFQLKYVFTKFVEDTTWGYALGIMSNWIYQDMKSVCLKRFVLNKKRII